ncbi:MAG: hypothetical protein WDO13_07950 [Verrucomicrobiota bacterium]
MQAAVVPVHFSTIPLGSTATCVLSVADPLVNKFPGDWTATSSPDSNDVTEELGSPPDRSPNAYAKGGTSVLDPDFPAIDNAASTTSLQDFDGDNPAYKPSGGGDPLSVWLPTQDIRLPKQARLPSIGALNSIRTGIIPDNLVPTTDATYPSKLATAKGTPWRSICFDAESGPGQTTGLGTYPDWAMLDLVTVPFLPQDPQVLPDATVATTLTQADPQAHLRRIDRGQAQHQQPRGSLPVFPDLSRRDADAAEAHGTAAGALLWIRLELYDAAGAWVPG